MKITGTEPVLPKTEKEPPDGGDRQDAGPTEEVGFRCMFGFDRKDADNTSVAPRRPCRARSSFCRLRATF